jgi:outer membrane protein assembly factor BamB
MSYKLIFLTVLFAFLALLFGLSQAQEEEKPEVSPVWIDEATEAAEPLSYARKCVAEKKFRPAIEVYQGLIEKSRTDKEYKSRVVHRIESVYLPLAKYCYGEILSLPEEGKQMYSILYAAKADRALGEAIQTREMSKLESVASDYLLTEAGEKALLCIADICMENSDFAVALRNLDKVAEYHYQGKAESALLVLKRAACYLRLGEAALARKMVEGAISGASKSLLSSTEVALAERLLAELKDTSKQPQQQSINLFYDSYIHLEKEPDISIVAQRKETQADTLDWRFHIDRSGGRYDPVLAAGFQAGYDLFPVVSGNLVFLTDSARVFAISIEGGKMRWREPSQEAPTIIGAPMGLAESEGVIYAVLRNANAPTGFGSRGQIESPVKALTDLYAFKADGAGSNPPLWSTSEMREGTLLGNITFTSIPLVEGKRIYLGGVEVIGQDMNYFIVCVTTDGMVLWKTRVCATKYTSGWSVASGFEFSALAVHHGSVIYCSNVGVLACLSFAGELEWLYKYPTSQLPAEASPFVQRQRGVFFAGGWQANAPIVWCGTHGGKVYEVLVLAPQNSDCLLAFSLRDKRLLWLEPRNGHTNVIGPRGDVICIYGGTAELETGKIGVRALCIPNGKIMWEVALDDAPAGKGIMTDKAIYIPCTNSLVKIEEVQVAPPEIPAKVTQSVEWYSFGEERPKEEAKRPEATEEQVFRGARVRIIGRQPVTIPQSVDETTAMGNLLFFGDRIITCGFSYTNSFRRADKK